MSRSIDAAHAARDRLLLVLLRGAALLTGAIAVLIVLFLCREAWPALRHIGLTRFVTDPSWHPSMHGEQGTFNLLPMLIGTLLAMAGSVALAAPIGILSAAFCCFFAPPRIARGFRQMIELLAGIPSVVYGFWGLVVLVPILRAIAPPGPSLLAGVLILAVMILPTIALTAEAALAAVPPEYLRGAAALGLSRLATVRSVAIPAARSGLLTGMILAVGRAIGETMAILMVCGNIVQVPHSVFAPIRTLTANIALEMAYALADHRSALFVSGLFLMAMIVLLVLSAELVSSRRAHD